MNHQTEHHHHAEPSAGGHETVAPIPIVSITTTTTAEVVATPAGDATHTAHTVAGGAATTPFPRLSFMLSQERGRATVNPRDVANLALWGLPTSEPLVENPKWAMIERKFGIRHVLVAYVNGVSLDNLLLGSRLSNLLLKPLRQGAYIPESVKNAHTMNAAFGGAPGESSPAAQMAPLWVHNTKNNLIGEFFLRTDRPPGTGGPATATTTTPAETATSEGTTTEAPTLTPAPTAVPAPSAEPSEGLAAGGTYQRKQPVSPTRGEEERRGKKADQRAHGVGLGQFMAALLKADKERSAYPKASEFLPTGKPPAPTATGGSGLQPNPHAPPELDPEAAKLESESATMVEDPTKDRMMWTADETYRWTLAFKPSAAAAGGSAPPSPTPGSQPKASPGGRGPKQPAAAVHMQEMVMTAEELKDHGFELNPTDPAFRSFLPPRLDSHQQTDTPMADQQSASAEKDDTTVTATTGGGKKKKKTPVVVDSPQEAVAIDCEMVQTEEGSTLARVTVLSCPGGACLLDSLVKPRLPVLDYVTRYSGITEEMLANVTTTLSDIQLRIQKIITTDTYVIGHSLENDFKALKMIPNCRVIDTTCLFPHPAGLPVKNALRFLVHRYFNRTDFQSGSHDSGEDAAVCIELVELKLRKGIDYGKPRLRSVLTTLPKSCNAYLFDRGANVQRVCNAKATNVTPNPCIDDDDVTKKTVRQLWKVRAEETRAAEQKPADQNATPDSEDTPCTFTWAQLTDIDLGNDLSDDREKAERSAFEAQLEARAVYDRERKLRQHGGGGSRKARKRNREEESHADEEQQGGEAHAPPVDPPALDSAEGAIHQLNLRLGAMMNAAPHRTLVIVIAANCREGAPNRLSAAHGAALAFIKDVNNYNPLPDNFDDLRSQLLKSKDDACAPS